jgi:hypothetical protein
MGRGPTSCLVSSPPEGFHLTAQGNLMETPSLMRKDNSSRPTHHRQLYKMRYRFSPLSCAGILTCSPFAACALIGAKCKLLGSHLGLANSRTITVRVKTFPTLIHKVLICVFATTTKICTSGSSTPSHDKVSQHATAPPYVTRCC